MFCHCHGGKESASSQTTVVLACFSTIPGRHHVYDIVAARRRRSPAPKLRSIDKAKVNGKVYSTVTCYSLCMFSTDS